MHASSALGDLTYTLSEDNWTTKDRFKWEVRESQMTPEIIEKRSKYLETHGWVANTMSMGNDGETEFFIDRKLLGERNISFAIGLMTESDPENMIAIPQRDAGDCAALSLVSGEASSSYSFDTSGWIKMQ